MTGWLGAILLPWISSHLVFTCGKSIFSVVVQPNSAKYGSCVFFGDNKVIGLPKKLVFKKGDFAKTIKDIYISQEGLYNVILKDKNNKVLTKGNPIVIKESE